jgi:thiol-disulfide isomerase/thioredoxin
MNAPDTPPPPASKAPDSKRRQVLTWSLLGLAAGAGALSAWHWMPAPPPSSTGTSAAQTPAWREAGWKDAQDRPIDLAGWQQRVVLLNFWATWCPPCIEEMPELSALHAKYWDRGFGVFGIGIDSAAKIAQFQETRPVSYPLAVGGLEASELAREFGNTGGMLPFSVLLDRQGAVVQRLLGRVKLEPLEASVRTLLG